MNSPDFRNGMQIGMPIGILVGVLSSTAATLYVLERHFKYDLESDQEMFDLMDEREADLKNKYTPCTELQREQIYEVKDWVLKNYVRIIGDFTEACLTTKSYMCDIKDDKVTNMSWEILHELDRTEIYCPMRNGDAENGVLGMTLRDADEERPGQMAIFPGSFDNGTCETAGTFLHELAHIATSQEHDPSNPDQNDWVYLLGDSAKAICELD